MYSLVSFKEPRLTALPINSVAVRLPVIVPPERGRKLDVSVKPVAPCGPNGPVAPVIPVAPS